MQNGANDRKRLRSESDDEMQGNVAKKLLPERYDYDLKLGVGSGMFKNFLHMLIKKYLIFTGCFIIFK